MAGSLSYSSIFIFHFILNTPGYCAKNSARLFSACITSMNSWRISEVHFTRQSRLLHSRLESALQSVRVVSLGNHDAWILVIGPIAALQSTQRPRPPPKFANIFIDACHEVYESRHPVIIFCFEWYRVYCRRVYTWRIVCIRRKHRTRVHASLDRVFKSNARFHISKQSMHPGKKCFKFA